MRPTHLSMTNFMPYAQPTELDLSNIHLACLAGENGHGKSAIIDALTWALWGKARARRDDELIHLGEQQMEVTLDFLLGDQQYRVIRQRDSAGRGSSTLEFQVASNGHWTPLTGDSIKETQEIIDRTTTMTYDLFINSALLLQGRADEFTNQPPGERKRILGEILNLSMWDLLEERAKAKVRDAEMALSGMEAKASGMEAELEKLPEYEGYLNAAAEAVERLQGELKEAEQVLSQVKEKEAELGFQRQALSDLERELDVRKQELAAIQRRIADLEERGLPEAEDELKLRRGELAEVKRQITDAETARSGICRLQLKEVQDRLAAIGETEPERESLEAEARRLAGQAATFKITNHGLKADMEALREEMDLLEQAGAQCPLCDSDLTDEHRQEILADKKTAGETKAQEYRANEATLKEIEIDRQKGEARLAEIKAAAERAISLREKEKGLLAKVAAAEALEARLAEWQEQLVKIEVAIEDAKARHEATKQLRIAEWQEQATALQIDIANKDAKRAALYTELRDLQVLAAGAEEARRKCDHLAEDLSRANLRVGAATQQIEHCQYLAAEKEKLEQQFQEASRAKALYDELRKAFGKRGIQAMIIETVLPEIEEQANELLGRMSDGRMSVSFESQRETKKGDIAETLDIQVSDELGVRSYDLFSGGERFRLDFAIRIAISRLLARRAGARLETLIMDEGFGTQDAGGRDRLVEAIQSVANSFDLILVVTHIEELREAFPNRIEVVKGPEGSLISVN